MTDKDKKIYNKKIKRVHDSKLWEHVTKDISPLQEKGTTRDNQKAKESIASKRKTDGSIRPTIRNTANTYAPAKRGNETDHRTAQRLQRGQIPIEGRLDLHGKTQNEAYDALLSFVPHAYHQGKRCVLIITGKGSRQGGDSSFLNPKIGILKQKTPEWLNTPPLNQYVLKIQDARPNHGGEGALYVLLRRER